MSSPPRSSKVSFKIANFNLTSIDPLKQGEILKKSSYRRVLTIDKNGLIIRYTITTNLFKGSQNVVTRIATDSDTKLEKYVPILDISLSEKVKQYVSYTIEHINEALKKIRKKQKLEDIVLVSTSDCHCDIFPFFLSLVLCDKLQLLLDGCNLKIYHQENDKIYINNGDYTIFFAGNNTYFHDVCSMFDPIMYSVIEKISFCKGVYFIIGNHDKSFPSKSECYGYVEIMLPNYTKSLLFIHSLRPFKMGTTRITETIRGITVTKHLIGDVSKFIDDMWANSNDLDFPGGEQRTVASYVKSIRKKISNEGSVIMLGHDFRYDFLNWKMKVFGSKPKCNLENKKEDKFELKKFLDSLPLDRCPNEIDFVVIALDSLRNSIFRDENADNPVRVWVESKH